MKFRLLRVGDVRDLLVRVVPRTADAEPEVRLQLALVR